MPCLPFEVRTKIRLISNDFYKPQNVQRGDNGEDYG